MNIYIDRRMIGYFARTIRSIKQVESHVQVIHNFQVCLDGNCQTFSLVADASWVHISKRC